MGPLFVIIFWMIFLFVAGTIFWGVIFFLIVPFIQKRKNKPKMSMLKRTIYTFIPTTFFSIVIPIALTVMSFWNSGDYWKDSGAFDYFRVPLEIPYQLSMIDDTKEAFIDSWGGDGIVINPVVSGIDSLNKFNNIVFGFSDNLMWERFPNNKSSNEWFIFDCNTGKSKKFRSESIFRDELELLLLDINIELYSTNDYYNKYWKEH